MQNLADKILKIINVQGFYAKYFQVHKQSGDEWHCKCCFHDDNVESLSINISNGLFKCFVSICPAFDGGNIFKFYELYHKIDFKATLVRLANELGIEIEKPKKEKKTPLKEDQVEQYMKMLDSHQNVKNFLISGRGLTEKTLKQFKLGFDGSRVAIPIYNKEGHLVNIRKYSAKSKGGEKMMGITGYNEARLYPIENLQNDPVFIMEGEMDCMLANQLGFNAITVTSGAGTWKEHFTPYFKNKEVFICYDIDEAGKRGAEKIAETLNKIAKTIKIISLPISPDQIPTGDFSDYVINMGYTAQDFENLVLGSPAYGQKIDVPKDDKVYEVHLSQAAKAQYFQKHVSFEVIVAGKDAQPYIIPKKIVIHCNPYDEKCRGCIMSTKNGEYSFDFNEKDNFLLHLINVTSQQQKGIIKQILGIKSRCNAFTYDTLENMNIEELRAIPHIDFSSVDKEYVNRNLFYVASGAQTNTRYKMTGITVVDPRNQKATQLIYQIEGAMDEISSFKMTPEIKKQLKIFQPEGSIEEKLSEIYTDFETNVTRIFQRKEFHLIIDLIYHTCLQFYFQDKLIKGWGEALVIGDTATGKSTLIQNIINHYQLGERMDSKNTTRSGLIGGMSESGTSKRYWVNWGRIPLNDRRLLVLEEIKAMDPDLIAKMTDMRSSGIAEVSGIALGKTNARTRLIWLSNPRSNMKLEGYQYGVDIIKELIGSLEDIRRFDLILLLRSSDVENKYLNMKSVDMPNFPHKYRSEFCKRLITWIWSRNPTEIEFTKDAEDKIIEYATVLTDKYVSSIPIVEAGDIRLKLARLSVAMAGRLFSCSKDGLKIVVEAIHVNFIYKQLLSIYKSKNLDYLRFIKTEGRMKITDNLITETEGLLQAAEGLFDFLLNVKFFTQKDLQQMVGIDSQQAQDIIYKFFRKRLIVRKGHHGYTKTPSGIEVMKIIQDKEEMTPTEISKIFGGKIIKKDETLF